MLCRSQRYVLTSGKNLMSAMFPVPFRQGGGHVDFLDDLSPTHACVVCAKRDLAFLCSIRNDAHLCASKIIVEKILEPHPCDEKQTPPIGSLSKVSCNEVLLTRNYVFLIACPYITIDSPYHINHPKLGWSSKRVVVSDKGQRKCDHRQDGTTSCVVYLS